MSVHHLVLSPSAQKRLARRRREYVVNETIRIAHQTVGATIQVVAWLGREHGTGLKALHMAVAATLITGVVSLMSGNPLGLFAIMAAIAAVACMREQYLWGEPRPIG